MTNEMKWNKDVSIGLVSALNLYMWRLEHFKLRIFLLSHQHSKLECAVMSFFLERETDGAKTGQSHLQLGKKGQRQQVTMVFLLYNGIFLENSIVFMFSKVYRKYSHTNPYIFAMNAIW